MRGALTLLGLACSAGSAVAAPWGQTPGEAYARLAVSAETVEGLDATRVDFYGKYGIAPKWTATAKAERIQFNGNSDFNAEGYRATIRRELLKTDHLVIAIEGGALYGGAFGGAPDGCDELGGEARIGAGVSGGWKTGRNWFAFADVAAREYESGCARQRVELGYGSKVAGRLHVVTQVWLERGSDDARSDKIENALVWKADIAEFSLAWREEISGRFDETGIVVAVSRHF